MCARFSSSSDIDNSWICIYIYIYIYAYIYMHIYIYAHTYNMYVHTYYVLTNPPIPSSPCNHVAEYKNICFYITREVTPGHSLVTTLHFLCPSLYMGIFYNFFLFFFHVITSKKWSIRMYVYTYIYVFITCVCVCVKKNQTNSNTQSINKIETKWR
jgi:hypothetical protein